MELYHSHLTDREQFIAYHRSIPHYDFKVTLAGKNIENRYNKNPHISYTCFVGCIDYLDSKGYIENYNGGSFRDGEGGSYGYLSRMRATEALVALWEGYKFICQTKHTVLVRDKMLQLYTAYVNKAFGCATEYNSALTYASTVIQSLRDTTITKPSKLVEAINVDIASTVEKRYEGKLPILKNNVIEISEESIQRRCSKNCNHYRRDTAARAGKRMFLGKIRIQTKVIDSVVSVEIIQ